MRSIEKAGVFFCFIILFLACQPKPYRQGQVLYEVHCENCHMEDGSGLPGLIPALSSYASWDLRPDSLICLIRNGVPLNPATGQLMPPNRSLNDVEIANLVNYLRSLYSENTFAIKVSEVKSWSESCH